MGKGRPQIGETKTIKLTLSSECWKWIEECIEHGHAKTKSELIRSIIEHAKGD